MADAPCPEHPRRPRYRLRPVFTPAAPPAVGSGTEHTAVHGGKPIAHEQQPPACAAPPVDAAFARPESEDDDGYDPYSDRPAPTEEPYQQDPWR